MSFYRDQVLPCLVDVVMRSRHLEPIRARVAAGLAGEVLEIGFGSGLNLPHYPPAVTRVLAVDPAAGPSSPGDRLARRRLEADARDHPGRVTFLAPNAEHLPLDDASVDHAVSTWTLCTIPDPARALAEIVRVLRTGGTFRFVEHGRAPDRATARWQDRLTPLQRRLAGGCHLNRPIDDLIRACGLDVVALDTYYFARPHAFAYLYEGRTHKR